MTRPKFRRWLTALNDLFHIRENGILIPHSGDWAGKNWNKCMPHMPLII